MYLRVPCCAELYASDTSNFHDFHPLVLIWPKHTETIWKGSKTSIELKINSETETSQLAWHLEVVIPGLLQGRRNRMVALHRCSDQKHPSTSETNKNLGFRSQMSTQEFSWNIAPHFEASKYPLDNTRYMSRDMTPIYLPIRPVLNTNGNELLIDPSRKSLFYGGPCCFRKVFAWSQRRRLRLRHIGTYYVPI